MVVTELSLYNRLLLSLANIIKTQSLSNYKCLETICYKSQIKGNLHINIQSTLATKYK